MRTRSLGWLGSLAVVLVALPLVGGCKKRELPPEIVGSYARSGDIPAELRAELSVARGGMVLTVVRLSASVDVGAFGSLFAGPTSAVGAGGGSASTTGGAGRSVVSARTFDKLACEGASCTFALAADKTNPACSGSFEKVQNTIIVVAAGGCQAYSGRWVLLDGLPLPAPSTSAPTPATSSPVPTPTPAPSLRPVVPAPSMVPVVAPPPPPPAASAPPSTTLEFPADIPAPHDHMSCLSACSIVDTRCHRTSTGPDRESFLLCVEKAEICRARCEQVWPFFSGH